MAKEWRKVTEASEVTDEIRAAAIDIHDGFYANATRIDWVDFMDRLDGTDLNDGTSLDLGSRMDSGAIKHIQDYVRAYRKL